MLTLTLRLTVKEQLQSAPLEAFLKDCEVPYSTAPSGRRQTQRCSYEKVGLIRQFQPVHYPQYRR